MEEVIQEQPLIIESVKDSSGNPFVLFILSILILALHYVIPLIGTIYSQNETRKWITYWITLLIINKVL